MRCDVYHLSLPIYDKSGGIVKITSNEERLLYRFGFEDKIEGNRIGTEITINQIRDLSKFTSTSPKDKHKFVIINNVEDLVNKYNQFKLLNEFEVKKKSISAKKYIKKYTIYSHFNKLSSILKIV